MRARLSDRDSDRRRGDRAAQASGLPQGTVGGRAARARVLGRGQGARPRRGGSYSAQDQGDQPERPTARVPPDASREAQPGRRLPEAAAARCGGAAEDLPVRWGGRMTRRYAYFPGCSAKGTCRELDLSTHAVAALFDVELSELENPGCTGAREFRAVSEQLHLTANGRILALAEREGCDLVAVCDTCLLNLTETNRRLKADAAARDAVNRALAGEGLAFKGEREVKHFLWVMTEDLGEERLKARVVLPLRGLKVAPFYGCHIQRPSTVYGASAAGEAPALDRLCRLLGAEVVEYPGADKCCGF